MEPRVTIYRWNFCNLEALLSMLRVEWSTLYLEGHPPWHNERLSTRQKAPLRTVMHARVGTISEDKKTIGLHYRFGSFPSLSVKFDNSDLSSRPLNLIFILFLNYFYIWVQIGSFILHFSLFYNHTRQTTNSHIFSQFHRWPGLQTKLTNLVTKTTNS